MKHTRSCAIDKFARDVCEGMYAEKLDHILMLHETLQGVYSLVGENPQIEVLCRDAVLQTGGDWKAETLRDAAARQKVRDAATDVLAALIGLLPVGWDDGTMDHMPGVKAARLAIARATARDAGSAP